MYRSLLTKHVSCFTYLGIYFSKLSVAAQMTKGPGATAFPQASPLAFNKDRPTDWPSRCSWTFLLAHPPTTFILLIGDRHT